MNTENKYVNGECFNSKESFNVQLTEAMLYDRLNTLAAEYSISVEMLVNTAVKRLIDDVDLVRGLRIGKIELKKNYYIFSFSKYEKIVRNTLIAICLRSNGWRSMICLNCSMILESVSVTESDKR